MMYREIEGVTFDMERELYDELFECEVDSYDIDIDSLRPAHIQFIQGMLEVEEPDTGVVSLTMTNDGCEYLLSHILPENMEMWTTWGSQQGHILLRSSHEFLQRFGRRH